MCPERNRLEANPRPGCASTCAGCCRSTWSRPSSSSFRRCPSPPAARSTGKRCRARPSPAAAPAEAAPQRVSKTVAAIWCEVLDVPRVGSRGQLLRSRRPLAAAPPGSRRGCASGLGREVSLVELLTHTTVRALARHLEPRFRAAPSEPAPRAPGPPGVPGGGGAIAIVGLAGRFPGAPGVETLWANLCAGVASITRFSDEELAAAGVARELRRDPRYVPAAGVLDGVELFDAGFFGYTPREAELLDPQQRLFLECAWEALEDAGYDSLRVPGPVGVFAGLGFNTYLHADPRQPRPRDGRPARRCCSGNDKDFLATRVSYKLNLKGPSVTVQTACSTSLVAVHLACQNLLLGACDMALAGGVSIALPAARRLSLRGGGHPLARRLLPRLRRRGGARHGARRAAPASSCSSGSTDALAARRHHPRRHPRLGGQQRRLRQGRLHRAERRRAGRGDHRGAGRRRGRARARSPTSRRTAPARRSAIRSRSPALAAGLSARRGRGRSGSCALGSVKTNLGHLDAAAGVTGLIKTVLALQHGQIPPPSLALHAPNPQIDFAAGPFHVARPSWPTWDRGRLAPPRRGERVRHRRHQRARGARRGACRRAFQPVAPLAGAAALGAHAQRPWSG